ncbi:Polyprenol monophosphomannose synthase [termite gut metagenome]|uniref:Polyprenol monophosphomannose synthase n=1 Tax=termite gut metagenome TaxID=433724 RepID=A0A5J4RH66_9ZZZZ
MIFGKTIGVVLPAYNCSKTLFKVYREIPHSIVDEIILVDDYSSDDTICIAKQLNIKHIIEHDKNRGYGANQKTCYDKALNLGVDIIIMLHPDYQYPPLLINSMAKIIATSSNNIVFASRMKEHNALKKGMPLYKYISNRLLTKFQNVLLNKSLSEYHTGYRGFSRTVLHSINYHDNSDDFIFDNQIVLQCFKKGYEIYEISCPAKYDKESSSINFLQSILYGLKIIYFTLKYKIKA